MTSQYGARQAPISFRIRILCLVAEAGLDLDLEDLADLRPGQAPSLFPSLPLFLLTSPLHFSCSVAHALPALPIFRRHPDTASPARRVSQQLSLRGCVAPVCLSLARSRACSSVRVRCGARVRGFAGPAGSCVRCRGRGHVSPRWPGVASSSCRDRGGGVGRPPGQALSCGASSRVVRGCQGGIIIGASDCPLARTGPIFVRASSGWPTSGPRRPQALRWRCRSGRPVVVGAVDRSRGRVGDLFFSQGQELGQVRRGHDDDLAAGVIPGHAPARGWRREARCAGGADG